VLRDVNEYVRQSRERDASDPQGEIGERIGISAQAQLTLISRSQAIDDTDPSPPTMTINYVRHHMKKILIEFRDLRLERCNPSFCNLKYKNSTKIKISLKNLFYNSHYI